MSQFDSASVQLSQLAGRLRDMGEEGFRREITESIKASTEPIPRTIRDGLIPRLPNRYARTLNDDLDIKESVQYLTSGVRVSTTARTLQVGGVKRRRIRRLDQGVLEHPLFGNRRRWYRQPVVPGWFTRPNEDAVPRVRASIDDALARVKRFIETGQR